MPVMHKPVRQIRRLFLLALCGTFALPVGGAAGTAPEPATAPAAHGIVLTVQMAWERSQADVERMRRVIASQQRLLAEARASGLVVAEDAVSRDLRALQELLSFAEDRLRSLQQDLAIGKQPSRPVADPLSYPQIRELSLLRDQSERIFLSSRRFVEQLQKPTGTRVELLPRED